KARGRGMKSYRGVSRRTFVEGTISTIAALTAQRSRGASAPTRLFEHGAPLGELEYNQVQFEPGLHDSQLERAHAALMNMSEDSALRPYRRRAGLRAPGIDLQGTEYPPTGHPFGQWLSALARYYAINQDSATGDKLRRLVKSYLEI